METVEMKLATDAVAAAERLVHWNNARPILGPVSEALNKLDIEPFFSGCLYVLFTGDKHKLADVVRILRTRGFDTTVEPPTENSSSWAAWYDHPDSEHRVYLQFSSSVCVRVQVGTEMKEVPVYETRCGEVPPEEAVL